MITMRKLHKVPTIPIRIRTDIGDRVLAIDWRTEAEKELGRTLNKSDIWDRAMLAACKIKEKKPL
jgi:hypothetical protein